MRSEACRCPGCVAGLTPFTVPHFRSWAAELVLDSGDTLHTEPFQEEFLEDLFSGVPEVWLVIPEGNGKTSFLAAVALYTAEHKPGCSIPAAASSRDQGRRFWEQANGFVKRTARLKRVFRTYFGYRAIDYCRAGDLRSSCQTIHSRIEVYAADEGTGDGAIPDLALVDEGHRHRDLGLYRTWRGKVEKRGGQIVMISTGGELGGEFEQTRTRILEATPVVARRRCFIRARSQSIAIHDYAIPANGDPEDMAIVKAANPLSTITVKTLRKKRATPTMTASHWRRFTCNRATRAEDAAISDAEWAAAATDVRIPEGAPIDLGVDVGWKWDTTALVPLWVRDARFRLLGPATVIVPPRDGNSLHPDQIKEPLRALNARNPFRRVVMDITHANDIAAWMRAEIFGCTCQPSACSHVLEHSQGDIQQAADYDAFMEALRGSVLHHSADADLTSHAMNARAKELPGDRHKFDRKSTSRDAKKQERRVIDALVAAAMVNSEASTPAKAIARDLPTESGDRARPSVAGILGRAF